MQAFLNRAYILRDMASQNKGAHIREVSPIAPSMLYMFSEGRTLASTPVSLLSKYRKTGTGENVGAILLCI